MTTVPQHRAPPSPGSAGTAVDQVMELIRGRGGRSTPTRRAVLEALVDAHADLRTADDLAAEVQSHYPSINGSTVYRTLDLLAELGVARHVHLGHGPSRWQLCPDRPCWYLACTVCGKVAEPDPAMFSALVTDVAERTGFVIDAGHFAITGTCAQCAGPTRKVTRPSDGIADRGPEAARSSSPTSRATSRTGTKSDCH
jgi:Fur family ferric uptake transcriptional regulator